MLNVGDKVFVPQYGAGIVAGYDERKICDKTYEYINIYIYIDNMDLLIPKNKIENYNIRGIITDIDAEKIFRIIGALPVKLEENWNKRYRENNKKVTGGNSFKIAEVTCDLQYLKRQNLLPPGEEKVLERAELMLASELMLVFNTSIEENLDKIRSII